MRSSFWVMKFKATFFKACGPCLRRGGFAPSFDNLIPELRPRQLTVRVPERGLDPFPPHLGFWAAVGGLVARRAAQDGPATKSPVQGVVAGGRPLLRQRTLALGCCTEDG